MHVQGEQAVRVEVVAEAFGAQEVRRRRAGGREQNAALFVERHAGPCICAARGGERTLGPGLRPRRAGSGNRVELPHQLAVDGVECADGPWEGILPLGGGKTEDDQILEYDARHRDVERPACVRDVDAVVRAGALLVVPRRRQIKHAAIAEIRHQRSIGRIQGDQAAPPCEIDALVVAFLPPHQAALRRGRQIEVLAPDLLAARRIERERRRMRRQPVEDAIDHQRTGVHRRPRLAGVVHPRKLQLGHIAAVDLRKRRIVRPPSVAEIDPPVRIRRDIHPTPARAKRQRDDGDGDRRQRLHNVPPIPWPSIRPLRLQVLEFLATMRTLP